MSNKKNRVILAAFGALVCFLSVGYFSCQKTGTPAVCDGVACQNGGYCLNGQCMCPTGYEDSTCSTAIISKYYGYWDVTQKVVKSDSGKVMGLDTNYIMQLKPTTTVTTFFLFNFLLG